MSELNEQEQISQRYLHFKKEFDNLRYQRRMASQKSISFDPHVFKKELQANESVSDRSMISRVPPSPIPLPHIDLEPEDVSRLSQMPSILPEIEPMKSSKKKQNFSPVPKMREIDFRKSNSQDLNILPDRQPKEKNFEEDVTNVLANLENQISESKKQKADLMQQFCELQTEKNEIIEELKISNDALSNRIQMQEEERLTLIEGRDEARAKAKKRKEQNKELKAELKKALGQIDKLESDNKTLNSIIKKFMVKGSK